MNSDTFVVAWVVEKVIGCGAMLVTSKGWVNHVRSYCAAEGVGID